MLLDPKRYYLPVKQRLFYWKYLSTLDKVASAKKFIEKNRRSIIPWLNFRVSSNIVKILNKKQEFVPFELIKVFVLLNTSTAAQMRPGNYISSLSEVNNEVL